MRSPVFESAPPRKRGPVSFLRWYWKIVGETHWPTVSRQSVDSWLTACRSTYRPTVDRQGAKVHMSPLAPWNRQSVDLSVDSRPIGRPTVDRLSTDSRPTVDWRSTDCRPPYRSTVDWHRIGRQSADRRKWISPKSFITISRMKEIIAFMAEVIKPDFLQESGLSRGHNSVKGIHNIT